MKRPRRKKRPEWRFLGDLLITRADRSEVSPLGKKSVALLAYLALTGERVSRDEVAQLLWPGPDPARSRHNLRQCLVGLRRSFGEDFSSFVSTTDNWLALDHDAVGIDALELMRIDAGKTSTPEHVVEICRGPFLRGLVTGAAPIDAWIENQRHRLHAVTRRVANAAYETAARAGQTSQVANLRTVLEAVPKPEGVGTEGMLDWGLLTKPLNRRMPRMVRRAAAGVAIVALVALALVGAYRVSGDVRSLVDANYPLIVGSPPKIAVLPFVPRNGTPEEMGLAGGVTLGVNYALYAITARELFVVTPIAKSEDLQPANALRFARKLGVRYLISGTLELGDGVVRVSVQCLDATANAFIWRAQFDKPFDRAFKLQDEITLEILKGLDIELSTAEWNRIQYLDDTENLHAWLAAANGVRHLIRVRREDVEIAQAAYLKALQYDPEYVSARRGLAWVSFLRVRLGWSQDPVADILQAKNQLGIVLRKRPDDGLTRSLEGAILLLEERFEDAVEAGELALELLPGSADATAVLAHTMTYVGRLDDALALIDRAMELSPMSPPWYRWTKGRALRFADRYEESVRVLEQDLFRGEPTLVHLVELAASYVAAGRSSDAWRIARRIKSIDPDFSASNWLLHPRIEDDDLQSLEFERLSSIGL